MICVEQKQRYFDLINEKLDADFSPLKSRCISVVEDAKILGVVVFDRFTSCSCELSIAAEHPRFLTKSLIRLCFYYAFVISNKMRITVCIKENNKRSIRLTKGLGFIEEARLKKAYGDQDGIIFRMLKEECKWIGENK